MSEVRDLEILVRSPTPLVVIESSEETRLLGVLERVAARIGNLPLFVWSVTEGLRRMEEGFGPQRHNVRPGDVLAHIKASEQPGIYLLLDFHPYLGDPLHVRLLKEIAQDGERRRQTVVLASHQIDVPAELRPYAARYAPALPDPAEIETVVHSEASAWAQEHGPVRGEPAAVQSLVRSLAGLTRSDARRLARRAVSDDGAITAADASAVARAKYERSEWSGALALESNVPRLDAVGGLRALRAWLAPRRAAFLRLPEAAGLDVPRGILLLGVQGCGKSLAAKAVAGAWEVPLLRLDFGRLYDKFVGETERRLREALRTSEAMAPCVLWVDEIEKGLAVGDADGGTAHRVLGTLLTWMSESTRPVFLVATANDVRGLPPELVRKGRVDEIFFVDLPQAAARAEILAIHLRRRGLDLARFDLRALVAATEGFSGAELEQAVAGALYAAHAGGASLETGHVLSEVQRTQPLSVVMAEPIAALRAWAAGRTVPAE